MTCSNCSSPALYALNNERVSPVYYCGKHLPAFLRGAAAKGQLDLPVVESTSSKKKSKAEPAPEPTPEPEASAEVVIEDEPVVEEEPLVVEEIETTEA